MNGDDGIAHIVLTGQQCLGFELVDYIAQRRDLALQVAINILAFFGEFNIGIDIVAAAA